MECYKVLFEEPRQMQLMHYEADSWVCSLATRCQSRMACCVGPLALSAGEGQCCLPLHSPSAVSPSWGCGSANRPASALVRVTARERRLGQWPRGSTCEPASTGWRRGFLHNVPDPPPSHSAPKVPHATVTSHGFAPFTWLSHHRRGV